jgi:ankyrin repeat protein
MLAVNVACRSRVQQAPATRAAEPAPRVAAAAAAATIPATAPTRAPRSPFLSVLIRLQRPSVLMRMIDAGADVNGRDELGTSTALYYAARGRFIDESMLPVVRAMVEKGADVNARCIGGCTALHSACECGSPDVVEYLISKGADVNAKDVNGFTPLHVAALTFYHGRADRMRIFRALATHGADINAVNVHGDTPRDLAGRIDHDPNVEALLAELGGRKHAMQEQGGKTP